MISKQFSNISFPPFIPNKHILILTLNDEVGIVEVGEMVIWIEVVMRAVGNKILIEYD